MYHNHAFDVSLQDALEEHTPIVIKLGWAHPNPTYNLKPTLCTTIIHLIVAYKVATITW